MTIIAHYRAYGRNVLIGDLLLSSTGSQKNEVHLPSSRDINSQLFGTTNFVSGLTQKIVQINRNLIVAWAGNLGEAKDFFESLAPLKKLDTIEPSILKAIFDSINDGSKNRLQLIAALNSKGGCFLFSHRLPEPAKNYFDIRDVMCAGTGSAALRAILKSYGKSLSVRDPNHNDPNQVEAFDFTVQGALYAEEFSSKLPLMDRWGGGFEVARLERGGFEKQRNILSLHFYATRSKDGYDLWWLPNFRHSTYVDDILVIQGIEHEVSGGRLLPGRRDVFLITPPDGEIRDLTRVNPSDPGNPSVVTCSVERSDSPQMITNASAYSNPVLHYLAPPGGRYVEAGLDAHLIADVTREVGLQWKSKLTYRGVSNRPLPATGRKQETRS